MTYYPEIKRKVYYSQNREDLILTAFFPDVKEGFYVDVGAYDPESDSVTKLFYEKGWKGMNIEPQPDRIKAFEKKRKRDINLNIGLYSKKGELKLRSYKNQGLSTFSEVIKNTYKSKEDKNTRDYKDITVEVLTLKHVFEENSIKKIHFLKVDVEGYEHEVLKGNDWSEFRPEVICIESNHIVDDWRPLLEENNYIKVFNDGLNDYYVDSNTNRAEKFDYVNNLLLKVGVGVASDDYMLMENLRSIYESTLHDANVKKEKIQHLEDVIDQMKTENNSIRKTTRKLISNIKRRLTQ